MATRPGWPHLAARMSWHSLQKLKLLAEHTQEEANGGEGSLMCLSAVAVKAR